MHRELHHFLARLIGVIAFTLIPVVLTAFVALPMSLGRHPGEPAATTPIVMPRHMT